MTARAVTRSARFGLVAAEADAHGERLGLRHRRHRLHVAVAGRAGDASAIMRRVVEAARSSLAEMGVDSAAPPAIALEERSRLAA